MGESLSSGVTLTMTSKQAYELLFTLAYDVNVIGPVNQFALELKMAMIEAPAWSHKIEHSGTTGLKFICVCGAFVSAAAGFYAPHPNSCPSCKSRCVAEALDPDWPKWVWDLFFEHAKVRGGRAHGAQSIFVWDRLRARFINWFAQAYHLPASEVVFDVVGGRGSNDKPIAHVVYFTDGDMATVVDLHWLDRPPEPTPNGITGSRPNEIDLEAGAVLQTMLLDEQEKQPTE